MPTFPFSPGASFDVVVVGGGIIGAGVARDAARRGLSVALFERHDFGSGTTAGSTRLVHGGLRYLEMLDFRLVRMDLRERETLLRIAPHLVRPLEFLVPFYSRSLLYRAKLRAGMLLYDALSYDRSLPGHHFLSASETLAREPGLRSDGLQGAATYWDAQVNSPERLTIENIVDACAQGAVAVNYAEVTGASGSTVRVRHALTGDECEVRARVVVNASGPWFDRVAGRLQPDARPLIRTTKGVHLACQAANRCATVLFAADGRLFFVLPWLGHTWIGTTDTDFPGDPVEARADADDVAYLLRGASPYFPALSETPVHWSNAGVRALVTKLGSESSVSRLHRIVDAGDGMVAIAGGKITGYRAIAEEAVDAVCRRLGSTAKSTTASAALPGGARQAPLPGGRGSLDRPEGGATVRERCLAALYGSRAAEVEQLAASDAALAEPLAPQYPDIGAQVVHAARREHCRKLADFMLRRSLLGFTADQGAAAAPAAARLLARELGWTAAHTEVEIAEYRQWVAGTQAFRNR